MTGIGFRHSAFQRLPPGAQRVVHPWAGKFASAIGSWALPVTRIKSAGYRLV